MKRLSYLLYKLAKEINYPELPKYVYHASAHADKIMQTGFKLGRDVESEGFGKGRGDFISTTTYENCVFYAKALKLAIIGLSGEMDYKTYLEKLSEHFPSLDKERLYKQLHERALDYIGSEIWEKLDPKNPEDRETLYSYYNGDKPLKRFNVESLRWDFISIISSATLPGEFREFPIMVVNKEKFENLKPKDVKIVQAEVLKENLEYKSELEYLRSEEKDLNQIVTYYPREKEWRFYDPSLLNPVEVITVKI